ncbi:MULTISPECIES: hypothetical protein [unclassified Paraburkholderia]|uniref:DUF7694 domain-containing protein n=1 Tax=unclassified Paraburkholderia TaxID=2615204 RepID=UPI0016108DEF|nr:MULTISPECIES: hypothetical protein [unclassified Paraburkholderia]MBB5442937.1 hypothetical protein [Paraburkholderia sp. WSM4177]MBB5483458.1 hypothetical protein [Paraburkholderia sp. WSM4180]
MRNLVHLERRRFRRPGGDAHNGAFGLVAPGTRATLHVIATNGGSWDRVSVTVAGEKRCPFWSEMAWVKDQFFEPGEAVMQLHPPRDQYVNNHPYRLHMWRPQCEAIPLPPVTMVGIAGMTPQQLAQMTPEDIGKLRALAAAGWKWSGP